MLDLPNPAALGERIGQDVAVSDWVEMTQSRIDQFADATDDRQWIHVDAARAQRESPYGATIAHGFLTLSLVSMLLRRTVSFSGLRLAINYGLDRVRFITAVPAGARIRGRFSPLAVRDTGDAIQVTWLATIEREHADKPCCVAEWLVRYYPL
jgi:acyl dehydratase